MFFRVFLCVALAVLDQAGLKLGGPSASLPTAGIKGVGQLFTFLLNEQDEIFQSRGKLLYNSEQN